MPVTWPRDKLTAASENTCMLYGGVLVCVHTILSLSLLLTDSLADLRFDKPISSRSRRKGRVQKQSRRTTFFPSDLSLLLI